MFFSRQVFQPERNKLLTITNANTAMLQSELEAANMQLVPSAGKYTAGAKRGKTSVTQV